MSDNIFSRCVVLKSGLLMPRYITPKEQSSIFIKSSKFKPLFSNREVFTVNYAVHIRGKIYLKSGLTEDFRKFNDYAENGGYF